MRADLSVEAKLTPRQIRQVEARLGPRLQAAGYAPSGLPPLRVSSTERFGCAVQNTLVDQEPPDPALRLRNVLRHKLARLFGLRQMEASAQSRMDRITLRT